MKNLKINAPEGYEIDQQKSDLEKGIVEFKKKSELPTEWTKELGRQRAEGVYCKIEHKQSMSALSKLLMLRDIYNDGWTPDWKNNEEKYTINNISSCVVSDWCCGISRVLAFKTEELRDTFLENFRDLIEEAKQLI